MLSAQTIRHRIEKRGDLIIHPFHPTQSKAHGLSYGLGAASYDVRLADGLWVFPGFGRLGVIREYLCLPADISAEVKDKSTNARRFVLVQNTFVDPGWRGYLTVEITRFLPWPIYLHANTPIAQIVFHELDAPTDRPYQGKYLDQGQRPYPAKLDK